MKALLTLSILVVACAGKEVDVGKYPFFALVEVKNQPSCAGVILTEELVMLPAHCTATVRSASDISIIVGEVEKKESTKSYRVKSSFQSLYFNWQSRTDDIGFLVMLDKFEFNANVQPLKKIYKYVEKENQVFATVGFNSENKMESFDETTMGSWTCENILNALNVDLTESSICTTQDVKENKARDSYILVSENGELVGLANHITGYYNEINIFTAVYKYEELIAEVKLKNFKNVV